MDSRRYDSLLRGPVVGSKFPGKRPCQVFSELAKVHPSAIALIWEDEKSSKRCEMTMDQLERKSNQLARGILQHCGQQTAPNNDGDRVITICVLPSWKFVSAVLAVWKVGAAYLPIEPPAPREGVKHMMREARPFLFINDLEEKDIFPEMDQISWTSLELISNDLPDKEMISEENYPVRSDPIEAIFYTSGSTGLPKGVRISSSSILNRLEWQWRQFPYRGKEEVCCFKSSVTFLDCMSEVWVPLLNPEYPQPVFIMPRNARSNPQLLVSLLHKYEVCRIVLVPTLLKLILTYLKIENTSLRMLKLWVCGSETLSYSLAREFFDWSEKNGGSRILCNFYGCTETMGDVTYYVMKSMRDIEVTGKVPIGIPVDNTILYLYDEQMRLVNSGEIGEVYIAGRNVAAGYVNGRDPFRFIESIHTTDTEYKTLFKTGDYAKVYNGILIYEGRNDSQVKVRGNRVDLSEIETALKKLPEVQNSVVLCYNPGQINQELVAFVQLQEGVLAEPTDIQNQLLLKSLPSFSIPQVTMINQIPLLVSGKIDRQSLLQHYDQLAKLTNGMTFDINSVAKEKRPASRCLWSTLGSVLPHAVSKLTPQANFYNIGGNSLNSILTIAKLSEAGYNISISDFIRSENLLEILNKMTPNTHENRPDNKIDLSKYKFEQISEKYKADIYRIIADSFINKSVIETNMDLRVEKRDYVQLLDIIWPTFTNNPLSFVVKDINSDEVVSCMLLMDINDETPLKLESNLDYILEFFEYLEGPLKETTLPEGKILYSDMLATDMRLSPQENVELTLAMEIRAQEIARQNGFIGIFTTNTSPLTRQLSETVLDYKQLIRYQLNQFVASDGTRPFMNADDGVIITCEFKQL